MPEQVTFKEGDKIKFQLLGHLEETGRHALPPSRERTYIGAEIIEKNGEPIEPIATELGLHNDELPEGVKFIKDGSILDVQGIDAEKYLEAELTTIIARATGKNPGQPVNPMIVWAIDAKTLRETVDSAPPISFQQLAAEQPATAPEPAPRSDHWFSRFVPTLFQRTATR